ncbi:MAG: cell wall hydrolase [Sphingomicrobium sp.]
MPKIAIPNLLDDGNEPQLSGDTQVDFGRQDAAPPTAAATDSGTGSDPAAKSIAEVVRTGDLSNMVAQLRGSTPGSRELECLATGVYFESKGEPLAGQLAVGQVIANRSTSGRFPSSYCGVLFQRGQFSFVRGQTLPSAPRSSSQWKTAVAIAKIIDRELKQSTVGSALFFHARYVSPGWRLKRVAAIGNHIFYR